MTGHGARRPRRWLLGAVIIGGLGLVGGAAYSFEVIGPIFGGLGAVCDANSCFCRVGAPKPRDCGDINEKCGELARKNGKNPVVYCKRVGGETICGCAVNEVPPKPRLF